MSETDAIPVFKSKADGGGDVGITNMSALTSGPGIKSAGEVFAVILVTFIVDVTYALVDPRLRRAR